MAAVLQRRDALKTLLAGGALALTSRPRKARAQSRSSAPRYLLLAYLSGGVDTIFTMDPKERREVDGDVDLTYAPSAIVGTGNVRLGPHWRCLEPWAERMAIVRGVRVFTANHPTGGRQLVRFRTDSAQAMPTLLDLVGAHRDGQPLATVTLGQIVEQGLYSASFFGSGFAGKNDADVFEALEHTTGEERALMSDFLKARARDVGAGAGARDETSEAVANLRSAERFFTRASTLPPWQPVKWGDDPRAQSSAADAQRALWFLENDLTRTVLWQPGKGYEWDTHTYNEKLQRENNERFSAQLARLLGELSTRKNEHGPLLDNTLVVVASELGRFPITNKLEGKDHFPEIALTFIGKGVRGGQVFGATGKRMEGARVSLRTGRDDASGVVLQLDDVGTTLLKICGIDETHYGYRGRSLDFLRA